MTLDQIYQLLKLTGYPVVYSHYQKTPSVPFVTYFTAYSSNFNADNFVYAKVDNLQIELYTDKKDIVAEKKLEDIFNANNLTYEVTETFIEQENLYQRIYEMRLI